MDYTDKENGQDETWGTGTDSRNPFETGSGQGHTEETRQQAWQGYTEENRQQSWQGQQTQQSWQGQQAQQSWQGQQNWQGQQTQQAWQTRQPRSGGSKAGKVLLVIAMILRGCMVLGSAVMLVAGGLYSQYGYDSGSDYYEYEDTDPYSYSWSFEYDFGGDGSDPFAESGYQTERERKDALSDDELEDTSAVLSEEEASDITSDAILGLGTSTSKPATEGQWIKTKKTIDGEAYDIYFRVKDIRPMDMEEIEAFNNSQSSVRLVPTSNPDFVDLMCTYEIYYPEGTPADRHQKEFYADIVSKSGYFEMKDGTVYQDSELDDVYDVTIDPENSVTREGELFTGEMTYAVTKDCSEYYILYEDTEAGGRAYIRCTYEQGA